MEFAFTVSEVTLNDAGTTYSIRKLAHQLQEGQLLLSTTTSASKPYDFVVSKPFIANHVALNHSRLL